MQSQSEALYPMASNFQPEKQYNASAPLPPVKQQPLLLGPDKTMTTCPFCQSSIKTTTENTVTSRTHITAILCFTICCCCIPYCSSSAQNTDHYCPKCNKYLGTYEK